MQNKPLPFLSAKSAIIGLVVISGLLLASGLNTSLLAQENQSPPVPPAPTETGSHPPGKIKKTWEKIKHAFRDEPAPNEGSVIAPPPNQQNHAANNTSSPALSAKASVKPKPKKPVYSLTTTPDGYQLATPGYHFKFPKDHASHPKFKTEWWYYTGHIHTDDGERYGYEVTFFRSGIPLKNPPTKSLWQMKDIYAAHFAVSDISSKRFSVAERLNRNSPYPGSGLAQADSNRFYVLNDTWGTWQIKQAQNTEASDKTQAKTAKKPVTPSFWLQADMNKGDVQPQTFWENLWEKPKRYKLAMTLTPMKEPVIHGKFGVSQKANCKGCASHYYSITKLRSEGTLWVNGKPKHVTGISWMDREFGSNQLTREQTGWDWFSVQLDNKTELMLYILRNEKKKNGKTVQYVDPNSSGTLVFADGSSTHLNKKDFRIKALGQWQSPVTGGKYPMGWQINIPKYNIHLKLSPEMENQELVTQQSTKVAYWEGSSKVSGIFGKKKVKGLAYVEMTGYTKKFRQRI